MITWEEFRVVKKEGMLGVGSSEMGVALWIRSMNNLGLAFIGGGCEGPGWREGAKSEDLKPEAS